MTADKNEFAIEYELAVEKLNLFDIPRVVIFASGVAGLPCAVSSSYISFRRNQNNDLTGMFGTSCSLIEFSPMIVCSVGCFLAISVINNCFFVIK